MSSAAHRELEPAGLRQAGAVYVYDADESLSCKIFPSDRDQRYLFGRAIDGIVGGASYAAFVFRRAGNSWVYDIELNASDAESADYLGFAVAADDRAVVAGAPGEDQMGSDVSAAYLFQLPPLSTGTLEMEMLSWELFLHPGHPNPFNASTQISYTISSTDHVNLCISNASGRVIRTLVSAVQPAGRHDVTWDGRDSSGLSAAAGVYYLRLTHAGRITTRAMTSRRFSEEVFAGMRRLAAADIAV